MDRNILLDKNIAPEPHVGLVQVADSTGRRRVPPKRFANTTFYHFLISAYKCGFSRIVADIDLLPPSGRVAVLRRNQIVLSAFAGHPIHERQATTSKRGNGSNSKGIIVAGAIIGGTRGVRTS